MDEGRESGFTEEEIERYLRAPDTLSDEDRARLARLLRTSDEAQRTADAIKRFFEELGVALGDPAPDVESLIHELYAAGSIVRLLPITDDTDLEEADAEMPSTLMAAATEAVPSPETRLTSSSYGSAEGSLLVRVLHDRRSGRCRVFVLTDKPGRQAYTVVSFPAVAINVATDVDGQAEFRAPDARSEVTWDRMETLVRYPLATYQVPGSPGTTPELPVRARGGALGDYILEFERRGQDIRIVTKAAHSRASSASLLAISRPGEDAAIIALEGAEAQVVGVGIRGGDEIRLYA